MIKHFDIPSHNCAWFICMMASILPMFWFINSFWYEYPEYVGLSIICIILWSVLFYLFVCLPIASNLINCELPKETDNADEKKKEETVEEAQHPVRKNKKAVTVVVYLLAYAYIIGFFIYCVPGHEHYMAVKREEAAKEAEQRVKEFERQREHEEAIRKYNNRLRIKPSEYKYYQSITTSNSGKSSGSKSSGSSYSSGGTWNSDAEEYAEEYGDEFDSREDAYDYWEEEHGDY